VLSTLHTNSAPETVTRLLDMGMDPFNFADSLLAVLAQRLVRRLCPRCRKPRDASDDEIEELLADWRHAFQGDDAPPADEVREAWRKRYTSAGKWVAYSAPGCDHCDRTGFKGRAPLHELMTVSRELRHLIQTGSRAELLQRQAMADGMRTLRQDGIEKVMSGVTSIAEVRASANS
jgi:type II secretory ATPase GspE/PulE/Tfp pilus assembly ATPase PilB-like protein